MIEIISNIASVYQELFARSLISKILSREMDSSQALLAEQSDDEGEEVNAALLHARALENHLMPNMLLACRRRHRRKSRRTGRVSYTLLPFLISNKFYT